MVKITYKDDLVSFNLPKSLLKDITIRKFLRYIRALEIIDKSTASDEEIEAIAKTIKETGKKEMERLLNER